MSGSVNKTILVGNLGRDPEIRSTSTGQKVATLSIATAERWTDKDTGEKKERTEWHRVVIFNENLATIAEQHLKKGAKVYVEGKSATRKYTGKDGIERYQTEVVLRAWHGELALLDSASRPAPSEDDYGATRTRSGDETGTDPGQGGDFDDPIPF